MRTAIFGSGGVGGYYGARLAQAGHDVTFIARGRHLEAMRTSGLDIESINGDVHLNPVQASDDPAEVGPVELVLVATKTHQIAQAASQMRPLIGAETLVLPLLNGVEAPAQLAAALPEARVLGGLTRIFSFIDRPGHIRHIGAQPSIDFGPLDGAIDARDHALRAALQEAGITTRLSADIETAMWHKFLIVVATGGVGAVARAPFGVLLSQPETHAMLEAAMQEIYEVAAARGVTLPAGVVAETLGLMAALPAGSTASMQRDIAAGRPSELDAWNGAVVRLGAEVGADAPIHRFIYHSLLPLERQARGEITFPTV